MADEQAPVYHHMQIRGRPKIGVCTACQDYLHGQCADEDACICAMRGHPDERSAA